MTRRIWAVVVAVAVVVAGVATMQNMEGREIHTINEEKVDTTGLTEAMFGAGCFWGVQVTFDQLPGVRKTEVGYSGGTMDNPTYKDVCYLETGHTEVVHVWFNPEEISYEDLLKVFFAEHDPTQVNRQGPDVGWQYRSVVFYYSDAQKHAAERMKDALNESGTYRKPVATTIEPARTLWRAEEYHQKYLEKRGLGQCHAK